MFNSKEEIIVTAILGTLLIVIFSITIILAILRFKLKQREYIKEKESLNFFYNQELLRTQLEIQEQTFRNISQEIHDNIGQVLILAKLNVSTLPDCSTQELPKKIDDTKQLIGKAIQDLRDLSKSLNPDFVSEMGLIKSIEYELELIRKAADIKICFMNEGDVYRLSPQKELIIFRIFQEVFNNIIKHSKTSFVDISILFHPENFVLKITDYGIGFNASNTESNKFETRGLGMMNMENRSHIIGAKYHLHSEPGKGTAFKLELPLSKRF